MKAALFACTGILLDRYGSVDEHALHGRARPLRAVGVLFAVGGLGLAGLPPFGTALGKSLAEEAAGTPLTVLYVLASAVTAGAVLRVAARVFLGLGLRPREPEEGAGYETTGSGEEPETRQRLSRVPDTMTVVPAVLLAASLAVGTVPGFAAAVAHAVQEAGTGGLVRTSVHWTPLGVLLGLASAALALALAAVAVARPRLLAAPAPAPRRPGPGPAATAPAVRARRRLRRLAPGGHLAAGGTGPARGPRELISSRTRRAPP